MRVLVISNSMAQNQIIATWVSFIIVAFRKANGLDISQFVTLDTRYKLIRFLIKNYELLHYYDNDYVVNDMVMFMAESDRGA